jgi:UDP-2,4-diacetamido-2,4,6-trideoxy-beta-L-altropyranose hydrolase
LKDVAPVRLRAATPDDCRAVFEWRNDPFIVRFSAGQRKVTWHEHAAWYDRVVDDIHHLLLIVERDGHGIGTVRFDREREDSAVVTIYLLGPHVGRGIGTAVLHEACGCAFARWPDVGRLEARIQAANARSKRVFEKVGFRAVDSTVDETLMERYR